jgi:hypothetical protein
MPKNLGTAQEVPFSNDPAAWVTRPLPAALIPSRGTRADIDEAVMALRLVVQLERVPCLPQ